MQLKLHMVTIEELVPEGHFLRKLEAMLDLSFVYEETSHLYSSHYGRPPIDPVVLVKYILVGFLYMIPSERQIEQRAFAAGGGDYRAPAQLVGDFLAGQPSIGAGRVRPSGASRPSGRYFGDCLKKWYGSASRKGW